MFTQLSVESHLEPFTARYRKTQDFFSSQTISNTGLGALGWHWIHMQVGEKRLVQLNSVFQLFVGNSDPEPDSGPHLR